MVCLLGIMCYVIDKHSLDNVLSENWCSQQDPKSGFVTSVYLQVRCYVEPVSSRKEECCLRGLFHYFSLTDNYPALNTSR